MKVSLAQINCVSGDLDGNTKQIIAAIRRAKDEKCDVVVFPETAITGYCVGALYDDEEFIKKQIDYLQDNIGPETENITAIIGIVSWTGNADGYPTLANSAIVLQNKKSILEYDKTIPASRDHHEDLRYFQFRDEYFDIVNGINNTFQIGNIKCGVLICEDVWDHQQRRDLVSLTKGRGAEILFVINQSYFCYGKLEKRINLIQRKAIEYSIPIVYLNNVGVGDIVKNIIIYDGGSFVVNSNGKIKLISEQFQKSNDTYTFRDMDFNGKDEEYEPPEIYSQSKYREIYDALIYTQKELFEVCGLKRAQVHLSGGIDSSIVAVIVAEAMGKENTVFTTNPSKQNDKPLYNLVYKLADVLGIPVKNYSIERAYQTIKNEFSVANDSTPDKIKYTIADYEINRTLHDGYEIDPVTKSTIQAVLRTVYGLTLSHLENTGIVATGNHTEILAGWANFHDIGSVGVCSLIGDLTKIELFEFAYWINMYYLGLYGFEPIPKELYNGEILPAAELVDASADPFDYFSLSGIYAEMVRNRKTIQELYDEFVEKKLNSEFFPKDWDDKTLYEKYTPEQFHKQLEDALRMSKTSVFKAAQGPPIVIISPRSRGFSNRETIINLYKP